MSTVRKFELIFLGTLILCLGWLVWYNHHLSNKVTSLEKSVAPSKATATAATVKSKGIIETYNDRNAAHVQLETVLAANPVWADEPLPDDLANSLRKSSSPAR